MILETNELSDIFYDESGINRSSRNENKFVYYITHAFCGQSLTQLIKIFGAEIIFHYAIFGIDGQS